LDRHDPPTDKRRQDSVDALEVRRAVALPGTLTLLRQKLHRKAKHEPKFRFYALYERIDRRDTRLAAWWPVLATKGVAGIDGVTIEASAATDEGVTAYLDDSPDALRTKP
jgi:RNA-directed DNA polymerase